MTLSSVPVRGLTCPSTDIFEKCDWLYQACYSEVTVFPTDRIERSAAVRIESVWNLKQPSWLWFEQDFDFRDEPCYKVWEANGKYRISGERYAVTFSKDNRCRSFQGSFIVSEIRNKNRAWATAVRIAERIDRVYDRMKKGLLPYEPCFMDRVFGVAS